MDFAEAVRHVFLNYADFNGRAGRSEYGYYTLFHGLAAAALGVLAVLPRMGVLLPLCGKTCQWDGTAPFSFCGAGKAPAPFSC